MQSERVLFLHGVYLVSSERRRKFAAWILSRLTRESLTLFPPAAAASGSVAGRGEHGNVSIQVLHLRGMGERAWPRSPGEGTLPIPELRACDARLQAGKHRCSYAACSWRNANRISKR